MQYLRHIPVVLLSLVWLIGLSVSFKGIPALGTIFHPYLGWWANAENNNMQHNLQHQLPADLKVHIQIDEKGIPYIAAENDYSLYFTQGYVHAKFRLWQMEMQTRAAGGELSEIIGEKTLNYDRNQRRKGMRYGAEASLSKMLAQPETQAMLEAYTQGVNHYIHQLDKRDYPIEYKLMGFKPREWQPLYTALLLMMMADDLTGNVDDIPMSYLLNHLDSTALADLYPERIADAIPVIPEGTKHTRATLKKRNRPNTPVFVPLAAAHKPEDIAQNTYNEQQIVNGEKEYQNIGSNNWAIRSEKTKDRITILANDPHLSLKLPSIWFINQLSSPHSNTLGVSIPGAPGIIIGFNDSISWGVTNNYRDVKDYYALSLKDELHYYFEDSIKAFTITYDTILIKGKPAYIDTILYSIHGPVQYNESFPEPNGSDATLAVQWMAHRATNELYSIYLLNRAGNYKDFQQAIRHFECPAQNFIYADRNNNIAIWGQGRFVNLWEGQGRFVMRGDIKETLWGDTIPTAQNPHVLNPPQKYLASANQQITDKAFPYWYSGDFSEFRSWAINYFLKDNHRHDIEGMQKLQNNTWSYLAHTTYPLLIQKTNNLNEWNLQYDAESKSASLFQLFWTKLYHAIWEDDFEKLPAVPYPSPERTMQLIMSTPQSDYYDDRRTPEKETLALLIQQSYKAALDSLKKIDQTGDIQWYKIKNTQINHLANINAFSSELIRNGGWGNTINAMKSTHGPSWRMIVGLNNMQLIAFGSYPGGQSGNPGSPWYLNFLDKWSQGEYDTLHFKRYQELMSKTP